MLTVEEFRLKAEKLWPQVLTALARQDPPPMPWRVSLAPPRGAELLASFSDVARWVSTWRELATSCHLQIDNITVRHRQLGEQLVPNVVTIPDLAAYLRLTGGEARYSALQWAVRQTLAGLPGLKPWLEENMQIVSKALPVWPSILQVVEAFAKHPRPGCYVRELDLPGIDTKFVEDHKLLLDRLLPHILPSDSFDNATVATTLTTFCSKYGLRYVQPLIRWRWLDPDLSTSTAGLADLSTPAPDFNSWSPPFVQRVFITENKLSGLTLPLVPRSMVIFGLGYGIDSLASASWLSRCDLFYWGDIDTHGFAILARLRRYFPHVRSFLMDWHTLEQGREWWVKEPVQSLMTDVSGLSPEEAALFQKLRDDTYGDRVRFEQEKIPMHLVKAALAGL